MDAMLSLSRVEYALDMKFGTNLIDLSDCADRPQDERRQKFLSRALAANCLVSLANADPAEAARSVTDGYHDQGIDAIYFDSVEACLYIVQSKWSQNASKGFTLDACNKLLQGVRLLIRADFSGFDDKIKRREPEILQLLRRADVRIVLVVAFSSPQKLAAEVKAPLDEFLKLQNNIGDDREIFSLEVFDLTRMYDLLIGSASQNRIKLQLCLRDWGTISTPYRAYYGQMRISDIAKWGEHGKSLLDRNIRFHQGSTEVNSAMAATIHGHPELFWYFNNGITVICSKIAKTALNGDARDYGVFECDGVCVVNGGQTVGVIADAAKRHQAIDKTDAHVMVRIISLEGCPSGFHTDIARATNTQNRIQNRDFAALDVTQQRLANEMYLDGGKRYAFKSGDDDPRGNDGCNIEEETVALACAQGDVSMTVLAKRYIGGFWASIDKPPYTLLFNEKLSAQHMWRAVRVSRAVSDEVEVMEKDHIPRAALIAVHGNRFIPFRVFLDPTVRNFRNLANSEAQIISAARTAARKVFVDLAKLIEELYPTAYLATLFKNVEKCQTLSKALDNDAAPKELYLPFRRDHSA